MKVYFGTQTPKRPLDWKVHVLDIHNDELYGCVRGGADIYLGQQIKPLDMRLDLLNKSPDGPSWGYGGSGPSQLAFALVYDAHEKDPGRRELALRVMHYFKEELVARIARSDSWVLSDAVVRAITSAITTRLKSPA